MGYRTVNERAGIVLARRAECLRSFGILGVPPEAVTFLGYPDADLERHVGRRAATGDHPEIIGGFEGLRNSLVAHIRRVRPAAVFLASSSDLHPDHQVVAREGLISTFHAAVEMWPELGEPMPVRPVCWEYLVGYGEPPDPPSLQLQAGIPVLQRKLEAVRAYESQGDIGGLLHGVAREGPYEYFWARNPPLVDKTKYGRYFMRW
jgi:LmbE family N-acetylglucosaminyl deacetylase